MHILDSMCIYVPQPWEPEFWGVFDKKDNTTNFYFANHQNICVASKQSHILDVLCSYPRQDSLPLPRNWRLITENDISYLMLTDTKALNLNDLTIEIDIPISVKNEYRNSVKPDEFYVENSFDFDNYSISHKGYTGFVCRKDGNIIWDFTGQAYLYTDINKYEQNIFFGTAGKGGYFYILNIDTGIPLANIKTGGTAIVAQNGGFCYFLQRAEKSYLICIDLRNGNIIDKLVLPGLSSVNSMLKIIADKMHVITFAYQNKKLHHAIWHTIKL